MNTQKYARLTPLDRAQMVRQILAGRGSDMREGFHLAAASVSEKAADLAGRADLGQY